ncbi:MAG: response regulator transcription factor [Anaerolineales bacterium]|nr:response regulator transcription factor [Anaerolineales bacterium]
MPGPAGPSQPASAALVLSERTVESHVSHILAKLGLETRSQVVAWAQRAGLT